MKHAAIFLSVLIATLAPGAVLAVSVHPGYQQAGKTLAWNDGNVLATARLDKKIVELLQNRGESVVGSVFPVWPTNPNILMFATVSSPDNGTVGYTIYTYHRLLGTIRIFYTQRDPVGAGAARALEPVGFEGSNLILRRVGDTKTVLPCNSVSLDWYLYENQRDLVAINVFAKTKQLNTYRLPRQVFDRGVAAGSACSAQVAGEKIFNDDTTNGTDDVFLNDARIPQIAGCQMFPSDNIWNKNILSSNVRTESQTFVTALGVEKFLSVNFGSNPASGIPYNVIGDGTSWYDVRLLTGSAMSNPGPYPIPNDVRIEANSPHRMVVLDQNSCYFYELTNLNKSGTNNQWTADLAAVFYLKNNWLRPQNWKAATASGIPLLPGLVKYSEVDSGAIKHPLLFTAPSVQKKFIAPATAGSALDSGVLPAFGARFRLRTDYDTSKLTGQARIIAEALKQYGMFLADYGPAWQILGSPDARWNDNELRQLTRIPGSAFEVVDSGPFVRVWFE